jgi:hypothetical protein
MHINLDPQSSCARAWVAAASAIAKRGEGAREARGTGAWVLSVPHSVGVTVKSGNFSVWPASALNSGISSSKC